MWTRNQERVFVNQIAMAKLFSLTLRVSQRVEVQNEWMIGVKPVPLDQPHVQVVNVSEPITRLRNEKYGEAKARMEARKKKEEEKKLKSGGAVHNDASKEKRKIKNGHPVVFNSSSLMKVAPMKSFVVDMSPTLPKDALKPVACEALRQEYKTLMEECVSCHVSLSIVPSSMHVLQSRVASLVELYFFNLFRAFQKKVKQLETIIRDPNAAPGMNYDAARDKMPYGTALLHLRCMKALTFQRILREKVDFEGQEISNLTDKQYRAILKTNRSVRIDQARKDLAARVELATSRLKDMKLYRNEIMNDFNNTSKALRTERNRAVLKFHERLGRAHNLNRQKEDAEALRRQALEAKDYEAYEEILLRQAGGISGAGEKYEAISKFLADTEAYLHKLAGKIASVKLSAEASRAASRAIEEARNRGMSEEEVQAAGRSAAAEAASGNDAMREALENMGTGDAQTRYYNLAHSNMEKITDQPKLLNPPNGAKLREYQIVGLQWMVSLYNNHLNGILADEMGLGKTVQVMALIAFLMENKSNYGPHLIIVPNAVIVNWKSELTQWLPSARCVYYVGSKEERTKKYLQEVQPLQFNILVTTYEYVMRDRAKLAKVDWQYIIIDEAQRMKDRQSKLARDLDRFSAVRRLLLSGTPLQNDLQELWSLLNLLLPDVFDDAKIFAEWFGDQNGNKGGNDWLDSEKRIVVVHRLHQILEPFMLRRQVEDVESKLPEKTTYTIHCPMSAHQSVTYSWIKATGTLRMDPMVDMGPKSKKDWATLQNKCMELRKVCNHPMLSYLPPSWAVGDAIVRQCGKLVVLDDMLVKLKASGHKVLLFSTMTRLLDILEIYLQWRELPKEIGGGKMSYLRIDGSTSLEDRESSIQKFNAPDSDSFIFLLSIRAAGRGLNLQSSDTVIIYDPDPNPKNEEQAIARSHRIGQKRAVKVFHLEAVTDVREASMAEPVEIEGENGHIKDSKEMVRTATNRKLYSDSIESLVRNQIQTRKIAMANEVIDAGRFDQQTSMEERRQTLETMLQDSERNKKAENYAPTREEINQMLARGEAELELFRKLDEEVTWFDSTTESEVPSWLRYGEQDLRDAAVDNAKHIVDIQSEIAALTGTVIHHAHAIEMTKKKEELGTKVRLKIPTLKKTEQDEVSEMIDSQFDNGPTMTTTTNRSIRDEDEEVTMGNDEEEEVLGKSCINYYKIFKDL